MSTYNLEVLLTLSSFTTTSPTRLVYLFTVEYTVYTVQYKVTTEIHYYNQFNDKGKIKTRGRVGIANGKLIILFQWYMF